MKMSPELMKDQQKILEVWLKIVPVVANSVPVFLKNS